MCISYTVGRPRVSILKPGILSNCTDKGRETFAPQEQKCRYKPAEKLDERAPSYCANRKRRPFPGGIFANLQPSSYLLSFVSILIP